MNIHEHQAKDILREFEAPVPKGVVVYNIKEIDQKSLILVLIEILGQFNLILLYYDE